MLGAGVMGEAVLSGLLRSGRQPSRIDVVDASSERQAQIAEKYGVGAATATEAVANADTVVLAVKPQHMAGLLAQIAPHLRSGTLVVSVAAGISAAFLEAALPQGTPVVRAMPNTPALVGEGMTAVSAGAYANAEQLREAEDLMRGSGKVIVVPEGQLDAVTAISGSGPAYIFYVVEAMIEGGVLLGMPRATATELVVQTLYGAATILTETGEHPTLLRERVSSPGGTTMAALRQLDENKVRAAFVTAMEAAARRSAELSSGQL
jgi:pyrroline-5-carboxylate reductase